MLYAEWFEEKWLFLSPIHAPVLKLMETYSCYVLTQTNYLIGEQSVEMPLWG
jgi:hypothetical protein